LRYQPRDEYATDEIELGGADDPALQAADYSDLWDIAREVLKPIELDVLYLHYVQDLGQMAISERLGVSRQTVNAARRRAERKILKALSTDETE
jgi:RNA polymerase sigma factor (sigma-70 family)